MTSIAAEEAARRAMPNPLARSWDWGVRALGGAGAGR
jgi:hypothetical protein